MKEIKNIMRYEVQKKQRESSDHHTSDKWKKLRISWGMKYIKEKRESSDHHTSDKWKKLRTSWGMKYKRNKENHQIIIRQINEKKN